MQRLLHEGMDAGLCRLLHPAPRPELGAGRLRRHARWSPTRWSTRTSSPWPRCCAERDEGFIQITQATGEPARPTYAFIEKLGRGGPAARSCTTSSPRPRNDPDDPPPAAALGGGVPEPRACRSSPSAPPAAPGSPSRSSTGTSTTPRPAWRAVTTGTQGREDREDAAIPSCARRSIDEAEEADKRLQAIQAGVGGNPASLIVQGVNRQRRPASSTSGAVARRHRRGRGQAPRSR